MQYKIIISCPKPKFYVRLDPNFTMSWSQSLGLLASDSLYFFWPLTPVDAFGCRLDDTPVTYKYAICIIFMQLFCFLPIEYMGSQ